VTQTIHTLTSKLAHAIALPYHHPLLFATWGTFLVAGAVAFWLEYNAEKEALSIRSFFQYCFPWHGWKTASARVDFCLYFLGKLTGKALAAGRLVFTGVLIYYLSRYLDRAWPQAVKAKGGALVVVTLSVLFFVAVDFANYVTHFLEHKIPYLWEFHKVHHSAKFLSPLTTARFHPFEKAFDDFAASILVGVIAAICRHYYSFSIAELLGMGAAANTVATLVVLDSLRHSQFPVSFGPFDRLLVSPHMHQLHHSVKMDHWNRNMGNKLSIFDWIFHTAFKPVRGEKLDYGTGDVNDDDYETVLGCYTLPIVKNYRMWKGETQETAGSLQDIREIEAS
jgi:sterol desaturase/sphingolipid hydroxylase (fatty acid hydroxylase superfamily)